MKVRIESDGTPWGTTVSDVSTGLRIPHVRRIEWKIDTTGKSVAIIEVANVELESGESAAVVRDIHPRNTHEDVVDEVQDRR